MYTQEGSEIRKNQWDGWQSHIREYCKRSGFVPVWKQNGGAYATRFQAYMQEQIRSSSHEGKIR